MGSPERVGVGIIGLGVVGCGIIEILRDRKDYFRSVRGIDLVIEKIAVRDAFKNRPIDVGPDLLTEDPEEVINRAGVQIVVEVMGGIDLAKTYIEKALGSGKDIITANKALLAEHGDRLFDLASNNDCGLAFEASVCGGIPIIRSITQGLPANHVSSLCGILNGTTNYILTKMTDAGGDFGHILEQAQALGYAEADPTMDVDGTDAVQKLAILCRLAFGVSIPYRSILREGITEISPIDITYAGELGYTIKLLGIAKSGERGLEARVHPALVPEDALLANIKDEFNAIEVVGDAAGPQVYTGRGAGSLPNASAVVSDLLYQAERRIAGRPRISRQMVDVVATEPLATDKIETSYYCRFSVDDTPGVLAHIAEIFAKQRIGIARVIQDGRSETKGGSVPLIMTTHDACERAMQRAKDEIDILDVVKEPPRIIRIESLSG
ncbi:MAG: homoserine dehydrogenase [Candidatus Latescibacterota bacterium]|nr:homoserine dehydrogenase [Candidatus Latescibacterota bacterium]